MIWTCEVTEVMTEVRTDRGRGHLLDRDRGTMTEKKETETSTLTTSEITG